jgi:hypothetical protein
LRYYYVFDIRLTIEAKPWPQSGPNIKPQKSDENPIIALVLASRS